MCQCRNNRLILSCYTNNKSVKNNNDNEKNNKVMIMKRTEFMA